MRARAVQIIVALSNFVTPIALTQTTAANATSQAISNDRLCYELALTHKVLADELFLAHSTDQAAVEYQAAKTELNNVAPTAIDVDSNEKSLLFDEVEYRQTLIKNGLSFWGGAYLRHPIDPTSAYQYFKTSVQELQEIIKRLDDLLDAASGKRTEVLTANEVGVIEQQKQADTAALANQKAVVQQRYDGKQIGLIAARIQDIQKRQQEISQESKGLRDQLSAAGARMSAILAKAITNAVGLPDIQSMQAVVKGQPLDKTLMTIADSMLLDEKSSLAQAVQTYSKTTADLVETYREINKTVNDANTVRRASSLLRARSVDDLVKIGASMYSSLDSEQQSKLAAVVGSPDLKTIVNLATKGQALREQVAQYLSGSIDVRSIAAPIVSNMISNQFADFAVYYPQFLTEALPKLDTALQAQAFSDALLQNWSKVIAHELFSAEVIAPLSAAMRISCADTDECRDKIAAQLASQGIKALPNASFDKTRFRVLVGEGPTQQVLLDMPSEIFVSRILKREIDSTREELSPKIAQIISQMSAIDGQFPDRLLSVLPNVSFDTEAEKLIDDARKARGVNQVDLASAIVRQGSTALQNQSMNQIATFMIGSTVASRDAPATSAAEARPGQISQASAGGAAGGQKAEEALALQALAMTGPYGAAIAVTVQLVSSIGAMNDLADKINRLNAEDARLTGELLQLTDLIGQARLSDALADLDGRIAERQQMAALAERDVLQTAYLSAAKEQQTFIRRAKLLMPRLWLIAELTRSRFDALDRSLATWSGNPSMQEEHVDSSIRSDPNWARYALDPDIDLYGWLDRSIEGTRTDIDLLREHWERLAVLAQAACQQLQCDRAGGLINHYGNTPELSLSELLAPSDWERLRRWQKETSGPGSIELPFFLGPKTKGMPDHLEGVRFADLSIAAARGVSRNPLSQAQLLHAGVGYLRLDDEYVRESFIPQVRSTLGYIVDPTKVSEHANDLQAHWGTRSMTDVEGYPLYAPYVLTIFRDENTTTERLNDIKLRFFYSYRPNNSIEQKRLSALLKAQQYWVQCDGATGQVLHLSIDDVIALVPAKATINSGDQFSKIQIPGGKNCHMEANAPR